MPRAIRRVAAPTNRSRSPSRRIGSGVPGALPCPERRSLPARAPAAGSALSEDPFTSAGPLAPAWWSVAWFSEPVRAVSPSGWAGMLSGAGRGRCASGSAEDGWSGCECSGPGVAGGPAELGPVEPDVPVPVPELDAIAPVPASVPASCAALPTPPTVSGLSEPVTQPAATSSPPAAPACPVVCFSRGRAAASEELGSAPRVSAGMSGRPVSGRRCSCEVGCSVTRVESIRPGLRAVHAVGPADFPIPGIRAPGTKNRRGQRLFLPHRRALVGPDRCCPRAPRSRPAAPR